MMVIDPYRFGGGGSCPSYTPGLYTAEEIDTLINDDGYIPVASAAEFDNIRTGISETMGAGTCWEGSYTTGVGQKYIQVTDIDFTSFGVWTGTIPFFSGVYDGNVLLIENITQSLALFAMVGVGSLLNIRIDGAVCTSATSGYVLARNNSLSTTITNCRVIDCVINGGAGFTSSVFEGVATYTDCYIDAVVSSGVGAVFNSDGGDFIRCVAVGSMTATSSGNGVSGFTSLVTTTSSYTECRCSVDVIATTGSNDQIGGFTGVNQAAITYVDCIFDGTVNARNAVGGFIGDHRGGASTLTNCIMSGDLTATGALYGGFCSRIAVGTFTASNSYWDTSIAGNPATSVVGIGKTTSELQTPTTNSGIYSAYTIPPWDFGTASEYPTLTTTP